MVDPIIIALIGLLFGTAYAAIKYYREYKKYKPFKKQYYNLLNPPKPLPRGEKTRAAREAYEVIRSNILLRDHFRCQECNYYKHLEVHHIIPKSKGGKDNPENLITLCQRCHAKKHGFASRTNRRGRKARRNRRKKFNRYIKRHVREIVADPHLNPISMEDIHPHTSDLTPEAVNRRKKLFEKWEHNELNQPRDN